MNTNGKHFEVRSPEGTLMFSVHVVNEATGNSKGAKNGSSNNGSQTEGHAEADSMTEPQRKYLFQILTERGLNSAEAHEELKRLFGVESLTTVGKQEASLMIKRLLKGAETES